MYVDGWRFMPEWQPLEWDQQAMKITCVGKKHHFWGLCLPSVQRKSP